MSNISISSHHDDKEIRVGIIHVKEMDFYTMKVGADFTFFVDTIEQLEKFAQDILLQVAALKEGVNNEK